MLAATKEKMSSIEKKSEQLHGIQHFLYKTKLGSFWKFHVVVVKVKKVKVKKCTKNCAARAELFLIFSLIRPNDFLIVFVSPILY